VSEMVRVNEFWPRNSSITSIPAWSVSTGP
jgi:hypothetical protein